MFFPSDFKGKMHLTHTQTMQRFVFLCDFVLSVKLSIFKDSLSDGIKKKFLITQVSTFY